MIEAKQPASTDMRLDDAPCIAVQLAGASGGMMGAVQLEEAMAETWQATGTEGAPNLKQVAAERLTAHRQRRAAAAAQEAELEARSRHSREAAQYARRDAQRRGASMVRDAVVARYQQRESYREFLAVEAERAIAQAQAEADVAARNARAVAEAQMQLLEELDRLNRPEPGPREEALAQAQAETRGELAHALADIVLGARELMAEPPLLSITEAPAEFGPTLVQPAEPAVREVAAGGLTVRLFEDMPAAPPRLSETRPRRGTQPVQEYLQEEATESLVALDEEIDFRRAPSFYEMSVVEAQPIPGNLIEFPRELVAPRRARPRLAEGPLTDAPGELGEPQLRIFEVDADQLSLPMVPMEPVLAPEWQTLQLEAFESSPAPLPTASAAQTHLTMPIYTASVERRLMAAAVDLCCIGCGWLGALACVVEIAGDGLRTLPLPLMAAGAVAAFAIFAVLYQMLFFSLNEGTPGMQYARIALCTFGDGNPTRQAMRRRVLSSLMAICPLGLGIAWALLDNDGLGWHDRMSRMYQRAY